MVSAYRRASAEADRFPEFVVLERLGEASRNRFKFDFPYILPRPFEEPDPFLAEGEDIEPVIAAEERQERLDVKMVGDDDEFAEASGRQKQRKRSAEIKSARPSLCRRQKRTFPGSACAGSRRVLISWGRRPPASSFSSALRSRFQPIWFC